MSSVVEGAALDQYCQLSPQAAARASTVNLNYDLFKESLQQSKVVCETKIGSCEVELIGKLVVGCTNG